MRVALMIAAALLATGCPDTPAKYAGTSKCTAADLGKIDVAYTAELVLVCGETKLNECAKAADVDAKYEKEYDRCR